MSLKDRITAELKDAMRSKEKTRLATIRAIRGEILKLEKSGSDAEITDDAVLKLIKTLVKQRQDAIEQFSKGGRDDLVESETAELEILKEFLPAQLGEDELLPMVQDAISQVGAESMKDMGKVMGAMQGKIRASGKDADNRILAQLVKSALGS